MSDDEPSSDEILSPEQAMKVKKAEVKNIVKKVQEGKSLSKSERAVLTEYENKGRKDVTYTKNRTQLADILGVTRQTLYNYIKRADFPKEDPQHGFSIERVLQWKSLTMDGIPADEASQRANPDDYGFKSGAKFTLARLANAEAQLAADYHQAYDDGFVELAATYQKQWLEMATKLKDFERIIAKDQRELGELMPKKEVVSFLTTLGQALSYAEESYLDAQGILVVELPPEKKENPREVRQVSKHVLYRKVNESLDQACAEQKVPEWMAEAVAEGLRPVVTAKPDPDPAPEELDEESEAA